MRQTQKKLKSTTLKKMRILLEMGQSMAISEPTEVNNKNALQEFKKEIITSKYTVYVNFNRVDSLYPLALIILKQCERIIQSTNALIHFDIRLNEDNAFYVLDKALQFIGEIARALDTKIIFMAEHFTAVLSLDVGMDIQELMRSIFQMEDKVHLIFTGEDKSSLNKIFLDRKAPFFRFTRIIDLQNTKLLR